VELANTLQSCLTAQAIPYISYNNETKRDLRYAYALPAATQNDPDRVLPGTVQLLGISPNPAATQTSILFSLGAISDRTNRHISLRIYDTLGRLVAMPAEQMTPSGTHSIRWNLRSENGRQVPAGIYYLSIQAEDPEVVDSEKLVLIR
jgi:hypothetical protein